MHKEKLCVAGFVPLWQLICFCHSFISSCFFYPKLTFMEQHDLLSNDLLINSISQDNLNSAAKWGRFLSIVGFVFCSLMLIGGLLIQTIMPSFSTYGYGSNPFLKYIGTVYIILAIILFFPCLYLLKFSNKMQEALRSSNQESLDNAFVNLKAMFKFYGVVTIVILCFYALIFLFGIGSTMMR